MRSFMAAALACAACSGSTAKSGPKLPAPQNVRAIREPSAAVLSWDAVAGATSYEVHLKAVSVSQPDVPIDNWYPVDKQYTAASFQTTAVWKEFKLSVRARAADGAGAESPALTPPPDAPWITAVEQSDGIALSWTLASLAGDVTLWRAKSSTGSNAQVILEHATGQTFLDSSVAPATRYWYFVSVDAGQLGAVSGASTASSSLPAPVGVQAWSHTSGVELQLPWTAVVSYEVGYSLVPGGPYASPPAPDPPNADNKFVVGCPPLHDCYYVVRGVDESHVPGAASAEVHARHAPLPPAPRVLDGRVGHIALEWDPVPDAASYVVSRQSPSEAAHTVASVAGPAFDDTAVDPLVTYGYTLQSVSADGHGVSRGASAAGMATPPVDQASVGAPSGTTSAATVRQTFTVGSGGTLAAVEIGHAPVTAELTLWKGPILVARASTFHWTQPPMPAALSPEVVQGTLYEFSTDVFSRPLLVSAGEHLTLETTSVPVLVSTDTYSGGVFEPYGVPDASQDLLFKTFTTPGAATAISLQALSADRSIALAWTAVPGSAGYEVLEIAPDTTETVIATTADTHATLAAAGPLTFAVRSKGVVLRSEPVTASPLGTFVDQSNDGLAQGVAVETMNTSYATHDVWTQSFTAGASGVLAGIELALQTDHYNFTTFELLDAGGAVLGVGRLSATGGTLAALSRPVRTGAFIDFSALHLAVAPGDALTLRATDVIGPWLVTPDVYAGGARTGGSGGDLVFRTWVSPN